MIIPIKNPHMISVGRCTQTMILENHMISEKIRKAIHSQIYFLSLFLIHRINNHIANPIDIAAWSDGKELFGKNLCNMVSDPLSQNNNMLGLSFSKKN